MSSKGVSILPFAPLEQLIALGGVEEGASARIAGVVGADRLGDAVIVDVQAVVALVQGDFLHIVIGFEGGVVLARHALLLAAVRPAVAADVSHLIAVEAHADEVGAGDGLPVGLEDGLLRRLGALGDQIVLGGHCDGLVRALALQAPDAAVVDRDLLVDQHRGTGLAGLRVDLTRLLDLLRLSALGLGQDLHLVVAGGAVELAVLLVQLLIGDDELGILFLGDAGVVGDLVDRGRVEERLDDAVAEQAAVPGAGVHDAVPVDLAPPQVVDQQRGVARPLVVLGPDRAEGGEVSRAGEDAHELGVSSPWRRRHRC